MKLLLLLSLAIFAQAGWITSVQSFFDSTIKTDKSNIELYGANARAYVFDVPNKHLTCILVYTESDLGESTPKSIAPVMQCVKN